MTDTERDEYELAALAAGVVLGKEIVNVDGDFVAIKAKPYINAPKNLTFNWNPKTDPGDSLRLAVSCGLSLNIHGITMNDWVENDDKADPLAATMLAIFRAAVEIGRAIKNKDQYSVSMRGIQD